MTSTPSRGSALYVRRTTVDDPLARPLLDELAHEYLTRYGSDADLRRYRPTSSPLRRARSCCSWSTAGPSPVARTAVTTRTPPLTDLTQLCGLNVATGGGTTFEATLEKNRSRCAAAGRKPYDVQVFHDLGAQWMSLQQGRSDVLMSTVNGLRYAVTQQENVTFLNEYRRLDVGFAFKKGTAPAPAFQAAVNKLKADGTYDRILKKWGLTDSAIAESRISPPEIPAPTK